MAKPKFDYNSNKFYNEIYALALQGLTDAEIADGLNDKFGKSLCPESFSRMKNGKYDGWNEKQNEERSSRICQVLTRARRKINSIVRGAYLKAALGGKKIKNTTRIYAEQRCDCKGADMDCPFCYGTGRIVSEKKSVIQETESELPYNVQAMATWLFHHDDDWRKLERKQEDDSIPVNPKKGIDIDEWIKNKIDD